MLLSTAYLPPTAYIKAIVRGGGSVFIEACESFQKQSWRNRCRIYSGDGTMDLSIPVCSGPSKELITSVKIDYSQAWIRLHKRALDAAYRHSPFYDYYRDELFAILDSTPECLWDLNMALTGWLLENFGLPNLLKPTTVWEPCGEDDFRDGIHPKRPLPEPWMACGEYYQIFSSRHGFIDSLSCVDLLFHEGPNAISFLG
ncbi:MAG: WbqC family protein [Bacteroidales bacterium]|nr:WbqC family protein [Bacteroidales bacterium]